MRRSSPPGWDFPHEVLRWWHSIQSQWTVTWRGPLLILYTSSHNTHTLKGLLSIFSLTLEKCSRHTENGNKCLILGRTDLRKLQFVVFLMVLVMILVNCIVMCKLSVILSPHSRMSRAPLVQVTVQELPDGSWRQTDQLHHSEIRHVMGETPQGGGTSHE